jgi:tetratricopeptide (TPR) repeat protein
MEDFNRSYELNTRFHEAYFFVGRTALEQGDTSKALKVFRHVLDYQPNRGDFHYYMGIAYQRENRDTEALEEFRKATAVAPAYGQENPMVYVSRGALLADLGYTYEGKKDILRALEISPDNPAGLRGLGKLNFKTKKYQDAIQNLTKALELEPNYPNAQHDLGMALVYSGATLDGIKKLQQSIEIGYDNPEVLKTLGYLYKELGKKKEAIDAFKRFLTTVEPEGVPLSTRKELLTQITELGG